MKKVVLLAMVAIMVFSMVGYAMADTWGPLTTNASSLSNSGADGLGHNGPVTVKATVNPKIELTVNTPDALQSVNWGSIDPGATYGGKQVTLDVKSNYHAGVTITAAESKAQFTANNISLSRTAGGTWTTAAPSTGFMATDDYAITVPWNTPDGAYSATVTYTVAQN